MGRVQAAAVLAALLVCLPLAAVAQCPFAGLNQRRLAAADHLANEPPGTRPTNPGQGAFLVPPGGIGARCSGLPPPCDGSPTSPSWVDIFQQVKQEESPDDDLCYWSYLPLYPRAATEEPFDFSNMQDDVDTLQENTYQAFERWTMQAVANNCTFGCDTVVGVSFSFGREFTRYVCATNTSFDPTLCAEAHLNQEWRWLMSSSIIRINGSNAAAVRGVLKHWRSSDDGHANAINSPIFMSGNWLDAAIWSAKLIKCKDIPGEFWTTSYPPPLPYPTKTNKTQMDRGLDFWSSYAGFGGWLNASAPVA